jgi:hypothetical protein
MGISLSMEAQEMPIRARSAACVSWLDLKMVEVQSEAASEATLERNLLPKSWQPWRSRAVTVDCITLFDYARMS